MKEQEPLFESEKKPLALFKTGKDGIEYFNPPKNTNLLYGAAHNNGGTSFKSAEPRYTIGKK